MPCPPNEFVPNLVQRKAPTKPKTPAYSAHMFKPYQESSSDVSNNGVNPSSSQLLSKL